MQRPRFAANLAVVAGRQRHTNTSLTCSIGTKQTRNNMTLSMAMTSDRIRPASEEHRPAASPVSQARCSNGVAPTVDRHDDGRKRSLADNN